MTTHFHEYRTWEDDSVFPSIDAPFFLDHVSRYYYAAEFAGAEDSALDVACGKGYGSAILARHAGKVLGVDLNEDSLAFANRNFGVKNAKENLSFRAWDVLKLDELGERFDLITAFEIIEHLDPRDTDRFLTALRRSLKPGGILLLSTPNHEVVTKAGVEVPDFHINNLNSRELGSRLRRHFPEVRLYGQYRQRGAFKDLIFHLDVLSWRHLVRRGVNRLRPAPRDQAHAANSTPRIWSPDQTPSEVTEYRFSPRVWRQAGLTFAVCSTK